MTAEDIEFDLQHINERLGELLDEVAALLVWTLQFAKRNHLERDEALGHHIMRLRSLIGEIAHPPSLPAMRFPRDESEQNRSGV